MINAENIKAVVRSGIYAALTETIREYYPRNNFSTVFGLRPLISPKQWEMGIANILMENY